MKKGDLHGIKKMCLAVEAMGRLALDLAQEVEEGDAVQEHLKNLGGGSAPTTWVAWREGLTEFM